jgi:hypothetical protein
VCPVKQCLYFAMTARFGVCHAHRSLETAVLIGLKLTPQVKVIGKPESRIRLLQIMQTRNRLLRVPTRATSKPSKLRSNCDKQLTKDSSVWISKGSWEQQLGQPADAPDRVHLSESSVEHALRAYLSPGVSITEKNFGQEHPHCGDPPQQASLAVPRQRTIQFEGYGSGVAILRRQDRTSLPQAV